MTFTYALNAGEAGAPQPSRSTNWPVQKMRRADSAQLRSESETTAVLQHDMVPLDWFIHWLPQRDLAKANVGTVCRMWLAIHHEHSLKFLVLSAGDIGLTHSPSLTHASVRAFMGAPEQVLRRAEKYCESLVLVIRDLQKLTDHYDAWMQLSFEKMYRLEIRGAWGHIKVDGENGLRLGVILSNLSHTVSTLILDASFGDEEELYSRENMAAVVCSFPKLTVLDIPWPSLEIYPVPMMPRHLAYCQGLGIDINNFADSFIAHAPHLKQLHLNIFPRKARLVPALDVQDAPPPLLPPPLDCEPFFNFLSEKCPQLMHLHIRFHGNADLLVPSFRYLPPSVQRLSLDVDEVKHYFPLWDNAESSHFSSYSDSDSDSSFDAYAVCSHFRTWVPESCQLYIVKRPGWRWKFMKVESATSFLMNPKNATCA